MIEEEKLVGALQRIGKSSDGKLLKAYLREAYMEGRLFSPEPFETAARASQYDLANDLVTMMTAKRNNDE